MNDGVVNQIHGIFNNELLRRALTKLRYPIVIALFILLIPRIKTALLIPGFVVSMFGELIQLWSFASLDKNKALAVKGPYMLTRNPMYIGRFFLLLGCLLLIGKIWLIMVFTVLYYFYMVNRVKREETELRGLFVDTYEEYCREVKRFWPSLRLIKSRSVWSFKWNLLIQNHGHWNLIAVLACYAIFYLSTLVRMAPG